VVLRILPGCIVCGLCEALAPRVFDVQTEGCVVRPCSSEDLRDESEAIQEAIKDCPVEVIVDSDPDDVLD